MRPLSIVRRRSGAFTLVETAVAIVVIGLIVGSVVSILDRLIGAMGDMRLRSAAFEVAREKMEDLLAAENVQDLAEYGVSDLRPEIQWQMAVEPFYEPISNAMWVRAVASAGYTDSKGDYQNVELEHWLTHLSANIVQQILRQQKLEQEYLDLMGGTATGQAEAAIQETTAAYLVEAGLNVDEYTAFLERQRRRKLDHIAKYGFDDAYQDLLDEMLEDENRFLARLGMDFDAYNEFARHYVPRAGQSPLPGLSPPGAGEGQAPAYDPSGPDAPAGADPEQRRVWTPEDVRREYPNIPESLVPLVVQLLNS